MSLGPGELSVSGSGLMIVTAMVLVAWDMDITFPRSHRAIIVHARCCGTFLCGPRAIGYKGNIPTFCRMNTANAGVCLWHRQLWSWNCGTQRGLLHVT